MIYKVIKKQYNSHMCFVCGIDNQAGLHTDFYELENHQLIAIFKGHDIHQSYPSRMHGGIIAALLDETIGRAIQIEEEGIWGVTVEISIKYHKPVPLDQELRVVGYITNNRRLLFEGEGYLYDLNQEVLATCTAKYMKQKVSNIINDEEFVEEKWIFVDHQEMPEVFELPR
jgi:uncharacterized protein (TIGR00369 family)